MPSTSGDVAKVISEAMAAEQGRVQQRIARLGAIGGQLDRFTSDSVLWMASQRTAFPGRVRAALAALGVDVTAIADWDGTVGPETPVVTP